MTSRFVGDSGDFYLTDADSVSGLYFPLAAEGGLKSAVTPSLTGDCKLGQDAFLLRPASIEDLSDCAESRNFWCRMEDGFCWSAAGVSARQIASRWKRDRDTVTVEAGALWQRVIRRGGTVPLESQICSWVPVSEPRVEVMWVKIRNVGQRTEKFTPTAAIPLYGRSADNLRDHRHVTSLLNVTAALPEGVALTPTYSFDERGHIPNEAVYFVLGTDAAGEFPMELCADKSRYMGEGGSLLYPKWVVKELPGDGADAVLRGKETIGALRFAPVDLKPGETTDYWILLGRAENMGELEGIRRRMLSPEVLRASLDTTRRWWEAQRPIRCSSAMGDVDLLLHWVGIQPTLRRIFGCSFLPHHDYGRGGRGWRDLWQDSLGLMLSQPEVLGEQLAAFCGGIRSDGTNATIIGEKPGAFKADRNGIARVWMDHAYWPVVTIDEYIQQTGDLGLLMKRAPYFSDGLVMRGMGRSAQVVEEPDGTVAEHLLTAQLTAVCEVGEHGMLRLRNADWNDALDMAAERGESVAFSCAYVGSLTLLTDLLTALQRSGVKWLELPKRLQPLLECGDSTEEKLYALDIYCRACAEGSGAEKAAYDTASVAEALRVKAKCLAERIRRQEWLESGEDGWFNSYYDNAGMAVESAAPGQERMMLTGQVFALMSNVADHEQAERLVRAARRLLFDEHIGGYRLNTDFGAFPNRLGRMFAFAYGSKENGSVFCHMAVMYAWALYQRGFVKEGFEALTALWRQALDFPVSRIYPGIPEYFAPDGRGMYHYLTGAAAWMLRTVTRQMYGVQGKLGALYLEPKLLERQFDAQNEAAIQLRFGGLSWRIVYHNEGRLEYGAYRIVRMLLDGEPIPSGSVSQQWIAAAKPGSAHRIDVILGEA